MERSTVKTIWGDRIAPWVADRTLGRTGYESHLADLPCDDDRPDNLFDPVPGDPGARGEFDDESLDRSLRLGLTKHRPAVGLAVLALVTAVVGALRDDE